METIIWENRKGKEISEAGIDLNRSILSLHLIWFQKWMSLTQTLHNHTLYEYLYNLCTITMKMKMKQHCDIWREVERTDVIVSLEKCIIIKVFPFSYMLILLILLELFHEKLEVICQFIKYFIHLVNQLRNGINITSYLLKIRSYNVETLG